jgi:hypothetical protein
VVSGLGGDGEDNYGDGLTMAAKIVMERWTTLQSATNHNARDTQIMRRLGKACTLLHSTSSRAKETQQITCFVTILQPAYSYISPYPTCMQIGQREKILLQKLVSLKSVCTNILC